MNKAKEFLLSFALMSVTACGSFPVNPPLTEFDPSSGYRFDNLSVGNKNTDSLYVMVILSGGGTRAASLSYGVMDTLERTKIEWMGERKTLLDEVDVISSVSGGSLTAAYYALNRKQIFRGKFEDDVLKRNIEKDLIKQLLIPANWLRLASPRYGRSDLAARFYDHHIFSGATYEDIPRKRPFVILNATDMTRGSQFPFMQDQFDLLCSNLDGLPVARAFASSSAFPGLLTPLTYKNFSGVCDFRDHPWVSHALKDRRVSIERTMRAENRRSYYEPVSNRRDYIHLVDGGVSDNIGLRGPYFAITTTDSTYSILQKINNNEIKKVLVVVANAAVSPDNQRDERAKVPGLVDTTTTAATVPLDNYSVDTIERLRSFITEFNSGVTDWLDCNNVLEQVCSESLPVPKPKTTDFYVAEIAFDYIEDFQERHFFQNIGTNFGLPVQTVDKLIHVGCELLTMDPEFRQLVNGDAGFTGTKVVGSIPSCSD